MRNVIAVVALSVGCSAVAQPAINRVVVEPGRSDASSYILKNTPSNSSGIWYGRALAFEALEGTSIVKKVVYTYYTGGDPGPAGNFYVTVSTNAGFTFGPEVFGGVRDASWSDDFDLSVSIRRRDGVLFLMPNKPFTAFNYRISTNNGATWTKMTNGTVSAHIGVWHRSILEENNGDLYACAYGTNIIKLAKSTNGGVNWTVGATIASGPYNEACLERCVDGSWLCITRENASTFKAMRSTNLGLNWTAPAALPVAVANSSIDPCLKLMPNGVLVFSYGNDQVAGQPTRDVRLAFSANGNGTTWTNITPVFVGTNNVNESTGYTCVWPIKAHSFMHSSDRGNSRNYTSYGNPPNGGFHVWARQANIALTGFEHRIDLKTKQTLVPDIIDSTTTMTHNPTGHPEGRSTGAFDGSTDYWSGAFSSGASGTFVIDLQQNYTLTGLGVCLQYNTPESATIQYSTNGSTWTTMKTYTSATHRAINYTTLTPVVARYVRATVTAASGLACLGEIELYTNSMETFENSAGVPVGYSAPAGGFTSFDGAGYQSQRGLRLWDQSSSLVTCGRTTTATATKNLEFYVKPVAITSGVQARITSGVSNVFRINFDASGNIKYLNSAGAYVDTTGTGSPATGAAPLNVWTLIRLEAGAVAGTAQLFVNGVLKGTLGKETTTAFTTLNGFSFNSGSSVGTGDGAYFDDVKFN